MKKNSMEERFTKQFKDSFSGGDMHSWDRAKPIIDFILAEKALSRAEGIEEAIKELEIIPEMNEDDWSKYAYETTGAEYLKLQTACNAGWNNAKRAIGEMLKSLLSNNKDI